MTTTLYTKDHAKAIDAVLADDQVALYKALTLRESLGNTLARLAGAKTIYRGRRSILSFDGRSAVTAEESAQRAADTQSSGTLTSWDQKSMDNYLGRFTAVEAEIVALRASINAAHKEWEDHGRWSRFFLVTGGHIHSSTSCHTLHLTTQLGWLPALSGETEKDAVDAHGALLCTVCFPSAPVEWTMGNSTADPAQCVGSGTWDYPRETARLGYAAGNYGVCTHCGSRVTVTSTGKMRKHKAGA